MNKEQELIKRFKQYANGIIVDDNGDARTDNDYWDGNAKSCARICLSEMEREAVGFAEWLSDNCYDALSAEEFYGFRLERYQWLFSQDGMCVKTTAQLYQLYKNQKQTT